MRLDLKVAILRSGLTQREVSLRARIPETRLSAIVRNRTVPTAQEQVDLSLVLRKSPEALFASTPQEAA
jgi:transcriptional regulator with XRE-family HTH domain